MGISDIRPFIKKYAPNCFVETPAVNLHKKRIAIDSYNWIFTYLCMCVDSASKDLKDPLEKINEEKVFQLMVRRFLKFNTNLLNYKITPVWIWDGEALPAKLDTKEKRREDRKKRIEKKNNIEKTLLEMNVLERPTELIKEFRKLQGDTFYFPKDRMKEIHSLCNRIGIPSIIASGEGEHLAASLAVERIVACVWSGDTDTYAMGAPFVTKKLENRRGELYIQGVFTPTILKTLELSHQEFRDFCIMCGCDFNKRVKGIGAESAYNLIKDYRSIENIIEALKNNDKYDTSSWNQDTCRKLLTPSITELNGNTDILNIKSEEYDDDLDKYDLKYEFDILFSRTRNFPLAENVPKN